VDATQLRRFVTVAEELNLTRAARKLKIPRTTLNTSINRLEEELGHSLFDRTEENIRLTDVGAALLMDARIELASPAMPPRRSSPNTGGKAKASKGKGRAPEVKGQTRPGKPRQSR
jgi:DNA-binding transcriptional LysR family regulator